MNLSDPSHLELLAETDTLVGQLKLWRDRLPQWPPSRYVRALIDRLLTRIDTLRVRFDAPLVVATLGGTGTGKSSLVNALVGSVVTTPGRERPTTRKPVLVCRPEITPAMLGIPADAVDLVQRDVPALRDLVLLDCPDPDTAEDADAPLSNTARLRELLPHCDVLLVTSTQQKYRSARVGRELASAAPGARLVFVQTHADTEDDIREDWREHLAAEYVTGEMFFVDSVAALADAQAGVTPRGEFGRLIEHLSRELSGSAAHRIRRANFLDLLEETLAACQRRLSLLMPAVEQVERAVNEQRTRLAMKLAGQMREELLSTRRAWESRLVGEVADRWGLSPFSLVLRAYHGVGGLLSGAGLMRVRTPAQLALWGAFEGARRMRTQQEHRTADEVTERAVSGSWEESELRTAAIIVEGYSREAEFELVKPLTVDLPREATAAGQQFVQRAAADLQQLVAKVAARQSAWLVRPWYEALLLLMLGALLYRLGKNFFFDSWLAVELGWAEMPKPLLGVDFFIAAAFVFVLWCGLLLTMFTRRVRRGLNYEIKQLAERWQSTATASTLFTEVEQQAIAIHESSRELARLIEQSRELQARLASGSSRLGYRLGDAGDSIVGTEGREER